MREYLIRTIDDEEFDIPYPKWGEVLRPKSYPSKVIEGWGALRLDVEGCEVSFSPEPPGTQIVFRRKLGTLIELGDQRQSLADRAPKDGVDKWRPYSRTAFGELDALVDRRVTGHPVLIEQLI